MKTHTWKNTSTLIINVSEGPAKGIYEIHSPWLKITDGILTIKQIYIGDKEVLLKSKVSDFINLDSEIAENKIKMAEENKKNDDADAPHCYRMEMMRKNGFDTSL